MRDAALVFRVALVPARYVPIVLRNLFVWLQARRDGQFGYYARFDVVLRWMGRRIVWDPVDHPVHRRIEDLLLPNDRVLAHDVDRQRVEQELARLTSFWVLVLLFVLLFVGDLFGSVQLFKTLGFDGFRRVLLAFSLSTVLFALPVLAVRFYTKKTRHWFLVVTGVLLLVIAAIAAIQLSETQTAGFALQDAAAGTLLALSVTGPALLAKFVLSALLPVWQLRKERSRLLCEIGNARRAERMAQSYVRDFHLYAEWYDSHAAQIASVYRRAFARKFLARHGDVERLRALIAADRLQDLDMATREPSEITVAESSERRLHALQNPYEP